MNYAKLENMKEDQFPFCPITGKKLSFADNTSEVGFWFLDSTQTLRTSISCWDTDRCRALGKAWAAFMAQTIFDKVDADLVLRFLESEPARELLQHDNYIALEYKPGHYSVLSLLDLTFVKK